MTLDAHQDCILPPQEYGDYAGWIALLDQPGDSRDLIAYDLLND